MENKILSAAEVCKQLFESTSTSTFDITKIFNREFLNKAIKWSGTIDEVTEFNYDFVFKNAKGVKVTVNANAPTSSSATPDIKAVICFPAELLDKLKALKGEKISFAGNMIKVDPSSGKIYINEGQITDPGNQTAETNIEQENTAPKANTHKNHPDNISKHPHPHPALNKKTAHLPPREFTHEELKRLNERKKAAIFLIIGIFVATLCIIIVIGMKFFIEGIGSGNSRKYKKPLQRIHEHNRINPAVEPEPVQPVSPLTAEFNRINRDTKRMPQQNAAQIEEIIRLWQKFVDKNEQKYPNDPKLKQAGDLIKNLKELKTMYEK